MPGSQGKPGLADEFAFMNASLHPNNRSDVCANSI